jgi:hypothetical protein
MEQQRAKVESYTLVSERGAKWVMHVTEHPSGEVTVSYELVSRR